MPKEEKLRILLIDDDRFLLDMYSLKFKKAGLDVDVASNATLALEKLRSNNVYNIILLDIIMPGMDGLDFLRTIKEEKLCPSAIIIMLTNQADDFEKAKQFNIAGYIIKAMTIPSDVVDQVLSVYKSNSKK